MCVWVRTTYQIKKKNEALPLNLNNEEKKQFSFFCAKILHSIFQKVTLCYMEERHGFVIPVGHKDDVSG